MKQWKCLGNVRTDNDNDATRTVGAQHTKTQQDVIVNSTHYAEPVVIQGCIIGITGCTEVCIYLWDWFVLAQLKIT